MQRVQLSRRTVQSLFYFQGAEYPVPWLLHLYTRQGCADAGELSLSPYCVPGPKRSVFSCVSPGVGTSVLSRGEEVAGRGESCQGCAGWRVHSFVHSFIQHLQRSALLRTTPALPWRASGLWVGAGIPGRFGGWPRAGWKPRQAWVNLVLTLWPVGQDAEADRGREPNPEGSGFLQPSWDPQ